MFTFLSFPGSPGVVLGFKELTLHNSSFSLKYVDHTLSMENCTFSKRRHSRIEIHEFFPLEKIT